MPPAYPDSARESPLKPATHLILLLLAEEPTYGVDLLERIEDASEGSIRPNAGSLYRLIGQLVDGGLIRVAETAPAEGGLGAPRKIYEVTDEGLRVLRGEVRRQATLLERARSMDLLNEG